LVIISSFTIQSAYPQSSDENYPSPRIYQGMVYHNKADKVLLFGGQSKHQWFADLDDIWSYDYKSNTWKYEGRFLAVPDSGSAQYPAYDIESNRVIVFNTDGETWAYDYENKAWEEMTPKGSPPGRAGHKMVYDSESDRIIMYGGFGGTGINDPLYSDTWSYDYNSNTWNCMNPSNSPGERMYFSMAYDTASDKVIVWGGRTFENVMDNSVWSYNYNSDEWKEIPAPKDSPEAYTYTAMEYSAKSDRIVLYGGATLNTAFEGNTSNAFWSYDFDTNTWKTLETKKSPVPKALHSLVYLPLYDGFLVFGGEKGTLYSNQVTNNLFFIDPTKNEFKKINR
jgi:N-acetylneuraminic acid mutarotase